MKFEKNYLLSTWNEWNHIIDASAKDFFADFGYHPHLLLANEFTFSQINFIANINHRVGEKVYKVDETTGEKEYLLDSGKEVIVNIFKNGNVEIVFCYDFELQDREFTLIYDDEAEWDSENNDTPINNLSKELTPT